jgi:hypothetical protein
MSLRPEEPLEDRLRRRVETQGFRGLDDDQLKALAPWLRFTPLANAVLVAVGALAGTWGVLAAGAALALWGTIFSRHPFDAFYNQVIAPLEQAPPLPPCPRRRLTYALMTAGMSAAAWLIFSGERAWALAFAGLMVIMLCVLAFTQICIASEIVERMDRKESADRSRG